MLVARPMVDITILKIILGLLQVLGFHAGNISVQYEFSSANHFRSSFRLSGLKYFQFHFMFRPVAALYSYVKFVSIGNLT